MEYFPKVNLPAIEDKQVPFLCSEDFPYKYNSQNWVSWPQSAGWWGAWNIPTPGNCWIWQMPWEFNGWDFTLYGERTPQDMAAFLQSWLCIGLLSEILQKDVATVERNFVRLKDSQRVLSTSVLGIELALLGFDP